MSYTLRKDFFNNNIKLNTFEGLTNDFVALIACDIIISLSRTLSTSWFILRKFWSFKVINAAIDYNVGSEYVDIWAIGAHLKCESNYAI